MKLGHIPAVVFSAVPGARHEVSPQGNRERPVERHHAGRAGVYRGARTPRPRSAKTLRQGGREFALMPTRLLSR
jgi:hypothetical protein